MKQFLITLFAWLHSRVSDKKLHFWAGFIIAILTIIAMVLIIKWNQMGNSLFLIPYFAFPFGAMIIVALAAGWKEIWWDGRLGLGCPDIKDFWWTMCGGIVGSVILWIVIWTFRILPKDEFHTFEEWERIEWYQRMEEIHKDDPTNTQELMNRQDSLKARLDSLLNTE